MQKQQQRAKAAAHQHMQSVKDFVLAGSQQQMLNAPCTTLAFASHTDYRPASCCHWQTYNQDDSSREQRASRSL